MSYEVTLPVLGESVTEGTVSRWLKRVGESVAVDEPLVEISTDKVDTEIPSPVAGILLEIRVQEDETASVGAVLAIVGEPVETHAPAEPAPTEIPTTPTMPIAPPAPPVPMPPAPPVPVPPAPVIPPVPVPPAPVAPPAPIPPAPPVPPAQPSVPPVPSPTGLDITPSPKEPPTTGTHAIAEPMSDAPYVTPLVRKLADENGVDLASIQGSGVGGRIRKQDILQAAAPESAPVQSAPELAPVQHAPEPQPAPIVVPQPVQASPMPPAPIPAAPPVPPTPPVLMPTAPAVPETQAEEDNEPAPRPVAHSALAGTTEKMSRLRATIARRMVESLRVSAQLTATVEVDLTLISRLRAQVKQEFMAREGVKLTYLPFIAKAAIEALKQYPKVNATIDTDAGEITYPDGEHLGIAVDTPKGLLVPVIKDAGDLSVSGLAKKITELGVRTRNNQLTPDELAGGTFTISNYGSAGTLFDTPIINQPQVAILGVGAIVRRPVVVSDAGLGEIVAIRDMAYISLSYDHRLVDGADAARFLGAIKARLEEGDFGAEL